MAKVEQAKTLAREAARLRKEVDALQAQRSPLEEKLGADGARAWSLSQLATLSESQLLAVRWALFDQRRALLGSPEVPAEALQQLEESLEVRAQQQTERLAKGARGREETQRAKTDRYRQIAREVIARGFDRFERIREFHKRVSLDPNLLDYRLSDRQAREYLAEAKKAAGVD